MKDVSPDGLNQAEPRNTLLWDRLLFVLVYVATLAVCLILLTHCILLIRWFVLRTDYAPGFTKANFERVRPGDTLDSVLDRLNAPLNFGVISQRQDDSRFKPQYPDDVSTLSKWSKDESVMLILRYSKPRTPDGSYHAYEVWISKGKVQETRAFNWWD